MNTDRGIVTQKGLTFIEVILCLAILGILVCFGTPFTSSLYKKNELQVVKDDIRGAIRLAKMTALVRGKPVRLTHRLGATDWSSGIVLSSLDGAVLYEWQWRNKGLSVIWHGFQSREYLLFSPNLNNSAVNGYFLMEDNKKQVSKITVNRLGQVRSAV